MNTEIQEKIDADFEKTIRIAVLEELQSIEPKHVMAQSDDYVFQTRLVILELAKGSLKTVIELTKAAKIDFRDVLMWAHEERRKKSN